MALDMELEEHEPLVEAMNDNLTLSPKDTSDEDKKRLEERREQMKKYFIPGDTITEESGFMRGHGTFVQTNKLISSVAGSFEAINRLISVKPPRTRFNGEVGDVVIGRVVEVQVQQKRWKVETNSRLLSILLISSINLPGGELRRKTEEDERMMRSYFVEGDLISAEVQSIFADGSLSLHTRSLKYGKLGQGTLVIVSPSLIQRRKTHFHNLPCGAHVILRNNRYIWISQPVAEGLETRDFVNYKKVPVSDRQIIVRLRNCISALAKHKVVIQDTSIMYAYEESLSYSVSQLLLDHVSEEVVRLTALRLTQDAQ